MSPIALVTPIPGLVFRCFQAESDIPRMLRVARASERPDEALEEESPAALARTASFDPYVNIILAEVDGDVVGYGRICAPYEQAGERIYPLRGYLLHEWRRKGIGGAMVNWLEDRVREMEHDREDTRGREDTGACVETLEGTHGSEEAKPVYAHCGAKQHQIGQAALLERAGYQPDHYYFVMLRPLAEPIPGVPLPPGIVLRPAGPEQYRAVWAAVTETAQDETGDARVFSEEDYQHWVNDPLFQPELWQIAWDESAGVVAGHVLTYIPHAENELSGRKRGFTEGIGVIRAWRKRGLATALIARSLQVLKDAGMTESALVVDSANPNGALGLYQRCGFQVIERNATYRKRLA